MLPDKNMETYAFRGHRLRSASGIEITEKGYVVPGAIGPHSVPVVAVLSHRSDTYYILRACPCIPSTPTPTPTSCSCSIAPGRRHSPRIFGPANRRCLRSRSGMLHTSPSELGTGLLTAEGPGRSPAEQQISSPGMRCAQRSVLGLNL
jgi:hypothetical protein